MLMKKIMLAAFAVMLMATSAFASTSVEPNPAIQQEKNSTIEGKATIIVDVYPSGTGSFTDDCGNTVEFTWSCNFDCSTSQILDAINQFVNGYGCGNYDEISYPY